MICSHVETRIRSLHLPDRFYLAGSAVNLAAIPTANHNRDACRETSIGAVYYSQVARAIGALQIWPEHRYYAPSPPYLPDDDFAQFTIEQSLVDHIELVLYVQALTNLTRAPVIALGSSYSKSICFYADPLTLSKSLHGSAFDCNCPKHSKGCVPFVTNA